MSDLSPDLIDDIVAACESNLAELAEGLSTALGRQISLGETVEKGTYDPAAPPVELKASGLVTLLRCGKQGLLAFIPDGGGLVPSWARDPSANEVTKLNSVAREIGRLLVPATMEVDSSSATWLGNLTDALTRGGVAGGAAMVKLALASEGDYSPLYLVWPAASPGELVPPTATPAESKPPHQSKAAESERLGTKPASVAVRHQITDLPPYARHLLKIEVPVMVNLVSKKQTIQEIMELGPGAIVNFEKSCDDPLELMVGNRRVALGSAVKVGDKFGIEITEVCLPEESFVPVPAPRGQSLAG